MEFQKTMANEYSSDQIKVLEDLEAVRKRPGMYIGSTGPEGLMHLINEVVDNSIDEALAGHCDRIDLAVWEDNKITVRDNGRGIPVDIHKEEGKGAVELVMTVLHSGGKFDDKSYQVAGGLHGVGISVVNALSEFLEVEVRRDGKKYRQSFERGEKLTELETVGEAKVSGTTITFLPDEEIFGEIKYDFTKLSHRLRELAYLNAGIKITLDNRIASVKKDFKFEGGIRSFVEDLTESKQVIHKKPLYFQEAGEDTQIEVALQFTGSYDESIFAFANNINTREGGTHLTGFKSALTRVMNEYGRKKKILTKNDPNLKGRDVREGLTAIINVKLKEPEFEGQTKTKLGNPDMHEYLYNFIRENLPRCLNKKSGVARKIVERSLSASRARRAAKKARQLARRKSLLSSDALPGKLADCSSRAPEKSEIFIVEGDSAGGSAKQGRNREFQAILPLRGKVLNVEKTRLEKLLDNKELNSIITALGTGIREEFNLDKLRYHRVIIMSVDHEELCFIKEPEGNIRSVRIGEFIDSLIDQNDDVSSYQVLCFNQDNQTCFKPIKRVIRHPIQEPLYEVKTAYGRSIKVTSSHSLFTYQDGVITCKRGDEIKESDWIVAPCQLPLSTNQYSHKIDILKELWKVKDELITKVWVRGPEVIEFLKTKVRNEYRDNSQLVEPRAELPAGLRKELKRRRLKSGLSQQEICEKVGIKQPCTYYDWEKGKNRPTISHLRSYVNTLGLESERILDQAKIRDSQLDNIWNTQFNNSGSNRVENYCCLNELTQKDLKYLDEQEVELSPEHYAHYPTKRYIPVNEKLMAILGFFVAEGSLSQRNGVRFAIGSNNKDMVDELKNAFKEVFGVEPKYYRNKDQVDELKVLNSVISLIFRHVFQLDGLKSTSKRIPDIVFNVDKDLQLAFLRGYFLGDGTIAKTGITMSTTSKDLAGQLAYLLLGQGILTSISEITPPSGPSGYIRGKPITQTNKAYTLTVTCKKDLNKLQPVWCDHHLASKLDSKINLNYPSGFNRASRPISEDLIALKVKAVRKAKFSKRMVYDFSVQGDENFIAGLGGLACHNTDADIDGAHIRTLLLTFFFRNFRALIENGHIYIAKPPLYQVTKNSTKKYFYNDQALRQFKNKQDGKFKVRQFKGLGEMNPEELWKTTMNPENRVVKKVTIRDGLEADELFTILMGSKVRPRRDFIKENSDKITNLDI